MKIPFLKLTNNFNTAVYKNTKNQFQNCNYNTALNLQPLKKDSVEISFEAKNDKIAPSDFQVKKIKNLRCPICSQLMLTQEQIDTFAEAVSPKKGQELIDALDKYGKESVYTGQETDQKSIYRSIEGQAVEILKKLAGKNPNQDLHTLFQIQRKKSLNNLIPVQEDILKEYEERALQLAKKEEQQEQIKELVKEYNDRIQGKSKTRFSRKELIYDAVHVFYDKKEQDEINKIVQKLPSSKDSVDAFFVKYSSETKNSKQAAQKLVSMNIPTAEHIVPQSQGGKDIASNYIVDCQCCNWKRQDTSFKEWIKTVPNVQDNLQDYLDTVQAAIDDGLLKESEYKRYIPNVMKTIQKESGKQINLKRPESKNHQLKDSVLRRQRNGTLIRLGGEIKNQEAKKEELAKEISDIENSSQYKNYLKYKEVSASLTRTRRQLQQKRTELSNIQARLKTAGSLSQKEIQALKKKKGTLKYEIRQKRGRRDRQFDEQQKIEGQILFLDKVRSQIKTLTKQRDLNRRIEEELEKKRKTVEQKIEITDQRNQLSDRILELEKEIKQLEAQDFDKEDKSQYRKYLHTLDLIKHANNLIEQGQNKNAPRVMTKELVQIALDTLTQRKGELEEITSVKYFVKKKELEDSKNKYEKLTGQMNTIKKTEEKIKELTRQNLELLKKMGASTDFEKKLQELKEQENQLLRIESLDSIKQEHEKLSNTISHNTSILSQMSVCKEINSREFEELEQQIIHPI